MAVISTATAYGLTPIMAKQRSAFENRFQRIWSMILSCGFGFTDLTYTTRMNMPFELGLMLALGKNCFITSGRRYAALRTISDLNLGDVHYHDRRPRTLIAAFSRWIEQNCTQKRIRVAALLSRFRTMLVLRDSLLGPEEFDRLDPEEISELLASAERNLGVVVV
jgi:hypothetical protein